MRKGATKPQNMNIGRKSKNSGIDSISKSFALNISRPFDHINVISAILAIPMKLYKSNCNQIRSFWPLLIIFLISCAHRTERGFSTHMQSWKGQPVSKLITTYGYPIQTHESPEGRKVYESGHKRQFIHGSYQPFCHDGLFSSPRKVYEYSCRVWFELHKQKIEKVTWRGNDCLMTEE